jgi:hypothetical protein
MKGKFGNFVFLWLVVFALLGRSWVFVGGVSVAAFALAWVHEPYAAVFLGTLVGLALLSRMIMNSVKFY